MDRVRFGRALGYGARHAAKTLAQAADAASAPNRSRPPQQTATPTGTKATDATRRIPDAQTVRAAGNQAKESLVTPVVRFSSVVWLQVTGVFFALMAFTMGTAAWRARMGMHAATNPYGALKVYAYIAFCALFSYFTVSSFVRAARK